MDIQEHEASHFSRHRIRILGTVGIVVGLIVAVLGGTSMFQSFDSLTGALTNSKKAKDGADLSITKTAPESMTPLENLVYRVTISNVGPKEVAQVRFTEPRHDTLTFASARVVDSQDKASCQDIGSNWVCVLDTAKSLVAGESRIIEITYHTHGANEAPACDKVFVTGPTTVENITKKPADRITENNRAPSVSTRVNCNDIMADVSVQTSANLSPLMPNENMRYTVSVSNNGPNKASGTIFKQYYSDKLQYVGASIRNCTVDEASHEVRCSLGDDEERLQGNLQPGETAHVELEFTVTADARCQLLPATTDLIIESDSVAITIDPESSNNTSSFATEVSCTEPETAPE